MPKKNKKKIKKIAQIKVLRLLSYGVVKNDFVMQILLLQGLRLIN